MGRLENLQPAIKPGRFKKEGIHSLYSFDDKILRDLSLKPSHQQFLELSKGSYSIKEICMFIYDRHKDFSFTDLYLQIESWAAAGVFKNSEEISDAIHQKRESIKPPVFTKSLSAHELSVHLRKVSLFSNLPPALIQSIIAASTQQMYKMGEVIIKKDSIGEDSYVVLGGSVGVYSDLSQNLLIATLPPLSVFGESAAVSNKKRTADVAALSDSLILTVNLKKIIEPQDGADLNKNIRVRLVFSQLMKTHPIFRNFPGDVIQMLLGSCRVEKAPAHKTILQQGEKGKDFYFILSGNVQSVKDRMPEARLSLGSYFGEVGVLQRQVRTASVVTETECTFLVLSERNFIGLLASNFVLALEIERS
ncbi:cyclic nucleotide-binding domain-containing protein, partial [bacterium]|nr:cyclic nucleotide-binding domain-containing protein [bacterium]